MQRKEKFITSEGKIDVEGMHNTYSDIEYIYTDDVEGAILPYKTYKDSKNTTNSLIMNNLNNLNKNMNYNYNRLNSMNNNPVLDPLLL